MRNKLYFNQYRLNLVCMEIHLYFTLRKFRNRTFPQITFRPRFVWESGCHANLLSGSSKLVETDYNILPVLGLLHGIQFHLTVVER